MSSCSATHRAQFTEVQGRLGIGRNTFINGFEIGSRLARDPARIDLITGNDLDVGGSGANAGNGPRDVRSRTAAAPG